MRKKTYIMLLSCFICLFTSMSYAQNISNVEYSSTNLEITKQQTTSFGNITPENKPVISNSTEVTYSTSSTQENDLDIIIADNPLIIIRGKNIDPQIFFDSPKLDESIIVDKYNNAMPENENIKAPPTKSPLEKDVK